VLASYRFDELDWHPPSRPPAIGFEHALVQESWSQHALIRDVLSVAPVAIPVTDATGRHTLAPAAGAVRFWFCPNWSSGGEGGAGAGRPARLLELVDLSGRTAQVRWSLDVGERGDALYFSGLGSDGQPADLLKAEVGLVAGEWQLITLNYAPEGSQLWLGDQLVAEGDGVAAPSEVQEPSLGLIIGSDVGMASSANGLFEELTTFDY
jgi:hypothetical protein